MSEKLEKMIMKKPDIYSFQGDQNDLEQELDLLKKKIEKYNTISEKTLNQQFTI